MCVDSLSLFELRVSGGCVACVRACVRPGRRLCGACAHALWPQSVHESVHVRKKSGLMCRSGLGGGRGDRRACFAEDFQTSSEIITAAIALGDRTARAVC